jgi:Glycosyl transferase family 11
MIIARITSGLGNQLFQYALGRSLAHRTRTALYFDLSYYKQLYETDTPRAFKLDRFAIDYKRLDTSPLLYVSKATRLLPNRTLKPLVNWVKEKHFHLDPTVLDVADQLIILDGFWQSEGYFADCETVIRRELTFQRQPGPKFAAYRQAIGAAEQPISVHIRRGDYVSHPEFSQSFGFVGVEYYRAAIARLTAQFPAASLFLFSDDPAWVAEYLAPDVPHVFIQNTGPDADLDDLQLMSLCKHHIIANSSFSWWGAWLNADTDKVVIAPKQWYKNKPDWDTKDLLPSSWIRL